MNTRAPRTVYYIACTTQNTTRTVPGSYTYDRAQAHTAAHDYAYALASKGAAYWMPMPGVFLISNDTCTSGVAHKIEVVSDDDGIDL